MGPRAQDEFCLEVDSTKKVASMEMITDVQQVRSLEEFCQIGLYTDQWLQGCLVDNIIV